MVFKGDFLSMDSDENLVNIFLLLLMTSHLTLVNITRFSSYACIFYPSLRLKFYSLDWNIAFSISIKLCWCAGAKASCNLSLIDWFIFKYANIEIINPQDQESD